MLLSTLLCQVGLVALVRAAPAVLRRQDAGSTVIPGQYIVQLRPGASPQAIDAHHTAVRRLLRRRDNGESAETLDRTFGIGDFNAYTGSFDDATASAIEALDEVLAVVPDQYVYVDPTESEMTLSGGISKRDTITQENSIWSLGDLSHAEAGATEYLYDESAGLGTTAYVFDTGIRLSHEEFEGRARFGINGVTGATTLNGTNSDTNGHGTHVAGTVGGKTFGVAKKASLVDVKVFEGDTGSLSAILTGLNWAVNDIVSKGIQTTSVLQMSLSARNSVVLDEAVAAAYQQGILAVVAAGNENSPATDVSPARVPQVFTVGMTQSDRSRVNIIEGIYGSNYGPELDVFAPGRDIISASHLSDTGNSTKTGTSMATPLVAGLVCYLRALTGGLGTPDEVTGRILELALKDVVSDPKGSPNLLVNNGIGA